MSAKDNVLACFIACGCFVLAGCGVFASHADYMAHRKVERADDDLARSQATAAYLREQPSGVWAEEYRARLADDEEHFYAARRSTKEGLAQYLEVYPEGVHAEEAKSRMAALASVQVTKKKSATFDKTVKRERRADNIEEQRLWARNAIAYWAKVLSRISRWQSPLSTIAKSNQEFSDAFGKAPNPVCDPNQCLKPYTLHYAIPVPGATRIDKDLGLVLRLVVEKGALMRAEILLPNHGWSRWYELEERELVTDEDPTARDAAVKWAEAQLGTMLKELGAKPFGGAKGKLEALNPDLSKLEKFVEVAPAEEGVGPLAPELLSNLATASTRVRIVRAGAEDYGAAYDAIIFDKRP